MLTYLLLLSAVSQTPVSDVTPATPPPAKQKKVCRRERTTTTRIPAATICKTQSEWDALAAYTAETMQMKGQSTTR